MLGCSFSTAYGMREYPKKIKKLIREFAAEAHERELHRELTRLDCRFAEWRNGRLGSGALSDEIHKYEAGPSRELFKRYNGELPDMMVAYAIAAGILKREEIPAELLEAIAGPLEYYDSYSIKTMLKRGARIAAPVLIILVLFRLLSPSLQSDVSFSQAIYDRSGKLLRLTLSRDDKYRLWLPLKAISPVLVNATLLHEDKWFRFHPGVSPTSLVRAIWHTYIKKDRKIGGSTITMQLARIKYDINSRTISGKTAQILAAIWLELLHSKNDILEAYLNLVPYGLNIEGAGAASLIYFHKNADKLTLSDALTLSVIPQSPARRISEARSRQDNPPQSPFSKGGISYSEESNPPLTKGGEGGFERKLSGKDLQIARAALFTKWTGKYPKDIEQKSFVNLPITLKRPSDLPFLAPHFSNEVRELDLFEPVLNTTLDLRLQKLIERHVKSYVEANRQKGVNNAVVLLADHRTLEVRSLIGSADFFDQKIDGQVNGARAKRSPGSALKPFIYGIGIDQGLIHPLTMLKDAPMSFGAYNPETFDGEFSGPIKAKDALVKSRNVPAVDIASRLASPDLHGFLLSV